MHRFTIAVLAGWSLLGTSALAQPETAPAQPYAGLQDRPIKALSAKQIEGLKRGQGMAMALPAELNRYPGPLHALQHADKLDLTPDQRAALQGQMQAMRTAAVALGERLLTREAELDALFATGTADAAEIDRLTAEIGRLQGALRAVHLRTHLQTRATLSDAQVTEYVRLRGYKGSEPAGGHRQH